MKALESLAERVQRAPPARRKSEVPSFKASPDLCNDGISSSKALETIQIMDKVVDLLKEIPIENVTTILLVDENEDDEDDNSDEDAEDEGEEE